MPGFTKAEREAMAARAEELKAEASSGRKGSRKAKDEVACLDAIAGMDPEDKAVAERVHAIVTRTAPDLAPKTWYGMPAYADADGKVVLFLQVRGKFGTRYCTLGFNDVARLDDGSMWPSAYAVTSIDGEVEQRIEALVTRACGVAEG